MTDENLDRFVEAQRDTYAQALEELRRGRKQSHWMWFVFPQIAGLGQSPTARHFAIRSADEARAYLAHPVLGPRLIAATRAVTAASGSAQDVLGGIDAIKLRSSMTLFARVAGDEDRSVFTAALDRFFDGRQDPETVRRL